MEDKSNHVFRSSLAAVVGILLIILIALPVLAAEEMPIPPAAGNCTKCHDAADHPMNNCYGCHDQGKYEPNATLWGGHGGLNVSNYSKPYSTGPVGTCQTCHAYTNECENCHPTYFGYSTPPALVPDPNPRWPADYSHDFTRINNFSGVDNTYTCEKCHIQSWWPAIPQHDSATFGSAGSHMSSTSGCESCHYTSLTTEHYRRTGASGLPLDCFSCHSSSSETVRQALKSGNTGCGDCHNPIHNLGVSPGMPADVLLYPGLKWTDPQPLSVWAGEPWVEEENPDNFRVIMSERANLSADDVFAFYRDGMLSRGWSLRTPEPEAGSSGFKAVFTKGTDKITVLFYSSEYYSGQGTVPTGARIQIIYNG